MYITSSLARSSWEVVVLEDLQPPFFKIAQFWDFILESEQLLAMSLGNSVEKSLSHLHSSLRWSTGHLFSKVGPAHCVPDDLQRSYRSPGHRSWCSQLKLFRVAFELSCLRRRWFSPVSGTTAVFLTVTPPKRCANRLTRLTGARRASGSSEAMKHYASEFSGQNWGQRVPGLRVGEHSC